MVALTELDALRPVAEEATRRLDADLTSLTASDEFAAEIRSSQDRRFLEGHERELARRSADLEALTRRFCMFVVGQL